MSDHVCTPRPGTPLHRLLDALEQRGCTARISPLGWQAQCPAHEDRAPSLSLREGRDGRALLHCHAGCETRQVLSALNLSFTDLFPKQHGRGRDGGSGR